MFRIAKDVRDVKAGNVYGRRTVLGYCFSLGKYRGKTIWAVVVECECGNRSVVRISNLKFGAAGSCRACKNRDANQKHGDAPSTRPRERLHNIWCSMRQRCNDTGHARYHQYGGRGISVCREWDDYTAFRDWARSHGYQSELSIDRIDNDGNYEPGNCQWLTKSENSAKQHTDKRQKLCLT